MCDYSLMGVPNRLAQEGEDLLTHRFRTGSLGLTPAGICPGGNPSQSGTGFWSMLKAFIRSERYEQAVAVCIPPGARLLVGDIPEALQHSLNIGPAEEATFTQLTAAQNSYRDAFRFKNGAEVLLQRLNEGQHVRVLELSAPEEPSRLEQLDAVFGFERP
jgi:hypothetical protein